MSCYLLLLSSILFYAASALSLENPLREDVMYILLGEEIFPISLVENEITKELISVLPLKSRQIQKDTSKILMPINAHIEAAHLFPTINTSIEGKKGDIILYQGKEIIILNEEITIENSNGEYVKIGTCEKTEEFFNKIEKNKTVLLWNTLNYETNKGKVKPYGNYNSIMNFFTWKVFTFFCFLLI